MTLKTIFTYALTLSVSSLSMANTDSAADSKAKPCRQAVVQAQATLGNNIEESSFSSYTFESLNISVTEFNQLDSAEQIEIYNQVKPIDVMVDSTIRDLTNSINEYVGTFYEFYMTDEISGWRDQRDSLRSCE